MVEERAKHAKQGKDSSGNAQKFCATLFLAFCLQTVHSSMLKINIFEC